MLARGFKRVKRVARRRPKVAADIGHSETAQSVREGIAQMQVAGIGGPTREEHRNATLAQSVEEMRKPRPLSKTPEDYQRTFEIERFHRYKVMDALEKRYGYALERDVLEAMALVMACPIKRNAPNWQHGRLVYALARHRLAQGGAFCFLDIGTAKGFSATCMALAACDDHGPEIHRVWSVDTIDPTSNEPRNSIKDGLVTRGIWDYCEGFMPEEMLGYTHFVQDNDTAHIGFLSRTDRIGFAFVDGGHDYDSVRRDIETITPRQQAGDIILFDDCHLADVLRAIEEGLRTDSTFCAYSLEVISLIPSRSYAIAVRQ